MADTTLHVRVVTPERPVHEGEASMVIVPAHDGEVGILPGHARFLSSLGFGTLRVHAEGKVHAWFLESGFVQVGDDKVTVLCDQATSLHELDAEAADAQAAAAAGSPAAGQLLRRAMAVKRVLAGRHARSGSGH